jgi:hypothetical protein
MSERLTECTRWTFDTGVVVGGDSNVVLRSCEVLHDPFVRGTITVTLGWADRLRVLLGKPVRVGYRLDADAVTVNAVMRLAIEDGEVVLPPTVTGEASHE